MRSRMLGLAIALSTFGLGVAATTVWIAYNTPNVPAPINQLTVSALKAEQGAPYLTESEKEPCRWSSSKNVISIGGNLNKRAVETAEPVYPPMAMSAGAKGIVAVQVLVDECGNVISAYASSGHPLLQQAAVQAAYQWRFPPTYGGEHPVKIRGLLTFNFVLQ